MNIIVRAMPAAGHVRRWCAQIPWGKARIPVKVVERPDRNAVSPIEISPHQLKELQADPHIAVEIPGTGDALEINALKARRLELEQQLAKARRDHQGEIEDLKAKIALDEKHVEELGAKAQTLQVDLARLNAELAPPDSEARRRR
jgi:hypothetical protein